MTPATPGDAAPDQRDGADAEDLRALAQATYDRAGPLLGVHVICRVGALILLSICAARRVDAQLRFAEHHRAAGGPHYWCELSDGTRLDLGADRKFRVYKPRRPHVA
jgi:hypothetical protein